MVVSASRRTDLPACYSDWLFRRLEEEYVLVRNPVNEHQISQISLAPEVVDGIVFWTKNPAPMLSRLSELERYPYYFQFTLTPYDRDVEPGLPSKNQILIPTFQELSRKIGRERVIWRYDPILLNGRYTLDYHKKYFRVLAAKLGDYTEKCVVSFLDLYKNTERNVQPLAIQQETGRQQVEILQAFAKTAAEYGIRLETCAEQIDLQGLNVSPASCVDKKLLERISGCKLEGKKDPGQRKACGCMASVDIGAYNTCRNGCLYCYANYNQNVVKRNHAVHDPHSPLLFGTVGPEDVVKEREMKSCMDYQMTLFDL